MLIFKHSDRFAYFRLFRASSLHLSFSLMHSLLIFYHSLSLSIFLFHSFPPSPLFSLSTSFTCLLLLFLSLFKSPCGVMLTWIVLFIGLIWMNWFGLTWVTWKRTFVSPFYLHWNISINLSIDWLLVNPNLNAITVKWRSSLPQLNWLFVYSGLKRFIALRSYSLIAGS